ncbi:hypothetical protein D3C85_1216940 [compost metagenome]
MLQSHLAVLQRLCPHYGALAQGHQLIEGYEIVLRLPIVIFQLLLEHLGLTHRLGGLQLLIELGYALPEPCLLLADFVCTALPVLRGQTRQLHAQAG